MNQHARTALLNINFGLQQDTAEHHALKAAATGQGAEEPDAGRGVHVGRVLPRREQSFFGDDSDGGHDIIHDDVLR